MATVSRPPNGNLKKAHDKLEEIAAILRDVEKEVQSIQNEQLRRKSQRAVRGLESNAERLSYSAKRLSLADEAIRRLAPAPSRSRQRLDTEKRTFRDFRRLPAELKMMIWEAAAQPPPCKHFFDTFQVEKKGIQPVSYLMEDKGLWEACCASRWAIERAYKCGCEHVNKTGCSAIKKKVEMHYRRLGRFNRSGKRFYEELCKFGRRFKEQYKKIHHLQPVVHSLYELTASTSYEPSGPSGRPLLTSEKFCKELRWASLFTDGDGRNE